MIEIGLYLIGSLCILGILQTYIIYPLALILVGKNKRKCPNVNTSFSVGVIIAAYNEENVIAKKIEEVGQENILQETNNLENIKTTFIKGELSNYINQSDEILINEMFKFVNIIEIKNAGHWVQAEKPEEFYKVICEILD